MNVFQKLESRRSIVMRSKSMSDSQREVWMKIMTKDFMSSEESCEEELDDGEKRQVLQVLLVKLRWRVLKVNRFFQKMDSKMAKLYKRNWLNSRPRMIGSYSTRSQPVGFAQDLFWIHCCINFFYMVLASKLLVLRLYYIEMT